MSLKHLCLKKKSQPMYNFKVDEDGVTSLEMYFPRTGHG